MLGGRKGESCMIRNGIWELLKYTSVLYMALKSFRTNRPHEIDKIQPDLHRFKLRSCNVLLV